MRASLLAGLPARDRNDVVHGLAAARREQTQVRLSQSDGHLDGTRQRDGQRAVPRSAERLQAAAEAQQQIAVELSKAAQRQPADRAAGHRAKLAWKLSEQRWQALDRLRTREIVTVRPR